jgi:hypothetical protein
MKAIKSPTISEIRKLAQAGWYPKQISRHLGCHSSTAAFYSVDPLIDFTPETWAAIQKDVMQNPFDNRKLARKYEVTRMFLTALRVRLQTVERRADRDAVKLKDGKDRFEKSKARLADENAKRLAKARAKFDENLQRSKMEDVKPAQVKNHVNEPDAAAKKLADWLAQEMRDASRGMVI